MLQPLNSTTGRLGVVVFGAATMVGHVPARFRARRATVMGVLMGLITVG